jgi:ABC-type multidrug transport system ATPase subunit
MLEICELSLNIGSRTIFQNLFFNLNPGSVYGILGPSGVGKSSLLNVIAGYKDPTFGCVLLDGKILPRSSHRLIPGVSEIALVSSTYDLDWNHTCLENIREAILGWPFLKREKRVEALLQGLALNNVRNTQAKLLSEGEKQRLIIGRAIAATPKWLLLDEPLGYLDFVQKQNIVHQLFKLGIYSVLMASHEVQDMLGICHKIATLNTKGKLSKFEDPQKKYFNLKNLKSAKLLGPVNSMVWNGEKIHFRPCCFSSSESGVELYLSRSWFNGMIYVHHFTTKNNEEIVLYHSSKLPSLIKIIPVPHEAV